MKGFRKGRKSEKAVLNLATGELTASASEAPFVRPPWHRARLRVHYSAASRTQQSHKDLTDINNIVNRYQRTGQLPPGRQGQYGDVTALQGDLGEVILRNQETIDKAKEFEADYKSKKDAEKAAKKAAKQEEQSAPPVPPEGEKKSDK